MGLKLNFVLFTLFTLFGYNSFAQQKVKIEYLKEIPASFRAITSFQQTLYFAGNKGYVGKKSKDTLEWKQLKGYEKSDFRSIYVKNENEVLIATAGSPALILSTKDFFETIDTVYIDTAKNAFLDAMYFVNKQKGFVLGDPKNGIMQLLSTEDGGTTWKDISTETQLKVVEGEAAFAASNSNITGYKNNLWIATGGKESHVFHSKDLGKTWEKYPTPIWQGGEATGIFSIFFIDKNNGLAVGGDYTQPNKVNQNSIYTENGGKTWKVSEKQVSGYRSGLVQFHQNLLFAIGPNGIDFSRDAGKNWKKESKEGFNAGTNAVYQNYPHIYYIGEEGKLGTGIYY